jgi:murein DD-endopeptidase MepM/ murein hydrolase activator NlpD
LISAAIRNVSLTALLIAAAVPAATLPAQAVPGPDGRIHATALPDGHAPQTLSVASHVETTPVVRDAVSVTFTPLVHWPVGAGATISDGFGARTAPTAGASTNHQGVDFAPGAGVPVHAAAEGVVRETVLADDGGCGVSVRIDHVVDGQGITTVYCHLAVGSVLVSPGQAVAADQVIAAVGNTGVSTGAHLHFEVRPGNGAAVEPLGWLRSNDAV